MTCWIQLSTKPMPRAVLESLDRERFQVGQDAVLKMGGGILCVGFPLRYLGC
jgi:hypothetical protein